VPSAQLRKLLSHPVLDASNLAVEFFELDIKVDYVACGGCGGGGVFAGCFFGFLISTLFAELR
jgi:hypothetical protein